MIKNEEANVLWDFRVQIDKVLYAKLLYATLSRNTPDLPIVNKKDKKNLHVLKDSRIEEK